VSLAGLRLGMTFDRVVLDSTLPAAAPMAEPASDFEAVCYSGGPLPSAAAAPTAADLCAEYSVHAAVLDDRIVVTLRSGSLCGGCTLDLGVDDALAGVWHARWLPLSHAGSYKPAAAACDPASALASASAPEVMVAAAPQPATPLPGEDSDATAAASTAPQSAAQGIRPPQSASRILEVAHTTAAPLLPRVQQLQAAAPPARAQEAPVAQLAGAAAGFAANVAALGALVAPIFAPPSTSMPGQPPSSALPRTTPATAPGVFSPPPLPPPAAGVRGWLGAIFAPQPSQAAVPAEQHAAAAASTSCAAWQAALFGCVPSPRPAVAG
jgi:hypothetical protein